MTFNIVGKDNEYYPIEMAEHLRGAIYEGPSNSASQVVSNLSNHGKSLYIKGGLTIQNLGTLTDRDDSGTLDLGDAFN